MEESTVIMLIVIGFILILAKVFAIAKSSGEKDDQIRWRNLRSEMIERYPTANYKAQIEFMRRDKYAALKIAINKNEDIADLTEEYQLLTDEYDRIDFGMRQLGSEFDPYVANSQMKG